ncbi:MAG TPA: hypothetical protein VFT72_19190 [Opitutaceae bacterium]|nr:hypothetical protein [Opitutaceae bacterium]
MQPSAVFASANSRLHADVMAIRLTKAGVATSKISAIYPERLKPNCADCWLKGRKTAKLFGHENETFVAAGPLAAAVSLESEADLVRTLHAAGLSLEDAHASVERLGKDQILISAEVATEEELSVAWHMFCELQADDIAIAATKKTPRATPARGWTKTAPQRKRPKHTAAPSLAMAIGANG